MSAGNLGTPPPAGVAAVALTAGGLGPAAHEWSTSREYRWGTRVRSRSCS